MYLTKEVLGMDLAVSILSLQGIKGYSMSGHGVGPDVPFLVGHFITDWTLKFALVPL